MSLFFVNLQNVRQKCYNAAISVSKSCFSWIFLWPILKLWTVVVFAYRLCRFFSRLLPSYFFSERSPFNRLHDKLLKFAYSDICWPNDRVQRLVSELSEGEIAAERHVVTTTDGFQLVIHHLVPTNLYLPPTTSHTPIGALPDLHPQSDRGGRTCIGHSLIRSTSVPLISATIPHRQTCAAPHLLTARRSSLIMGEAPSSPLLDGGTVLFGKWGQKHGVSDSFRNVEKMGVRAEMGIPRSKRSESISSASFGCGRADRSLQALVQMSRSDLTSEENQLIRVDGKGVIFFQHGLLESSLNWVCLGKRSLAFMLFYEGYDIWIGNNRGNAYSKCIRRPADSECDDAALLQQKGRGFLLLSARFLSITLARFTSKVLKFCSMVAKALVCSILSLASLRQRSDENTALDNLPSQALRQTSRRPMHPIVMGHYDSVEHLLVEEKQAWQARLVPETEDPGDWSFEDMACYDIPAMLHYILERVSARGNQGDKEMDVTISPNRERSEVERNSLIGGGEHKGENSNVRIESRRLICIGQSQGAAQLLVGLSLDPSLSDHLASVFLLSPPVVLNKPEDCYTLSVKILMYFGEQCPKEALAVIRFLEWLIPAPWLSSLANEVAGRRMEFFLSDVRDADRRIIFKTTPSGGTSTKNLKHWLQILSHGGVIGTYVEEQVSCSSPVSNRDALSKVSSLCKHKTACRRARSSPYALEKIRCPLRVFYGGADNLVNVGESLQVLAHSFPPEQYIVKLYEEWGHVDFGWGSDRHKDFYPGIIDQCSTDFGLATQAGPLPETRGE